MEIISLRTLFVLSLGTLLIISVVVFVCLQGTHPSDRVRRVQLTLLYIWIKDFQKFHSQHVNYPKKPEDLVPSQVILVTPSLDNFENEGVPTLSWRCKILNQIFVHRLEGLNPSLPYDHPENRYRCELTFRGQGFYQVHSSDVPGPHGKTLKAPVFPRKPVRWVADQFCYEYNNSYYKSSLYEDTNILTISGRNTVFDPEFAKDYESFPDDLIVLVEVHSDIHWTEPCDIDIDDLLANRKSSRYEFGLKADKKGFYVVFFDEQIWYLKKDIPPELLGKLATIEGATMNDREEVLKGYILRKYGE